MSTDMQPEADRGDTTRDQPADTRPAEPRGKSRFSQRMRWQMGATTIVGAAIGILLLVIGVVALARTGIPAEDLTEPAAAVGPFGRTALMAVIEIIAGLFFLASGVSRAASMMGFLGLLAVVFGIVWLIEPGAFQNALGIGRETAWLYLGIGLLSTAAAWAMPMIQRDTRTVRLER